MISNVKYSWIICLFLGCGLDPNISTAQTESKVVNRLESRTHSHASKEKVYKPLANLLTNINFQSGDMRFSATIDEMGNVRVKDYPSEWRGKIKLLRFDGSSEKSPFSLEHCEEIRRMAELGLGVVVRSNFHSLVSIELPPFLSGDFIDAIRKSIEEAGIKLAAFNLMNPVDIKDGTIELHLDNRATARIIGEIELLKDQIHIGNRGFKKGPFEKHLLVRSGDILCDLAQNKAAISMTFGLENENKFIKVIYENMEIALQ